MQFFIITLVNQFIYQEKFDIRGILELDVDAGCPTFFYKYEYGSVSLVELVIAPCVDIQT